MLKQKEQPKANQSTPINYSPGFFRTFLTVLFGGSVTSKKDVSIVHLQAQIQIAKENEFLNRSRDRDPGPH